MSRARDIYSFPCACGFTSLRDLVISRSLAYKLTDTASLLGPWNMSHEDSARSPHGPRHIRSGANNLRR